MNFRLRKTKVSDFVGITIYNEILSHDLISVKSICVVTTAYIPIARVRYSLQFIDIKKPPCIKREHLGLEQFSLTGWTCIMNEYLWKSNSIHYAKSHFPPGNHHASHLQKCSISRS